MWKTVAKENLDKLFYEHPFLEQFRDELLLDATPSGAAIFPRHIDRGYPSTLFRDVKDSLWSAQTVDIEFTAGLRDYQEVAMGPIRDLWNNGNTISGVVEGRPGSGKTVFSAYITGMTKLKTLILLDNTQLMKQWIEAYEQFTNCTEIGTIQGKKFDTDCSVTIGMVQTFMSKARKGGQDRREFYEKVREQGYGLVFFDEAHKSSCAPKYALSSLFLNTPNLIGLTATPPHNGLHKILIESIIGTNIALMKDYETIPKMHFVKYSSQLEKKKRNKILWAYNSKEGGDYIKLLAMHNSVIFDDPKWLEVVERIARQLVATKHRSIVITSTVKQVEGLVKHLQDKGIPAVPFYAKKREFDRDKDVLLVATQKYASAGFDWKELSALVLACPMKGKTSLVQTVGRILRSCIGKEDPVVYDLIDSSFGKIFTSMIDDKMKVLTNEFDGVEYKVYTA